MWSKFGGLDLGFLAAGALELAGARGGPAAAEHRPPRDGGAAAPPLALGRAPSPRLAVPAGDDDGRRRSAPPRPLGPAADGGGEGDDERRPTPGGETMRRRSSLEAGFDRWLDRQLHEIYDPVLDEAIPDEIASLLDRFQGRAGGGDEGSGGGGDAGPKGGGGGGV